MKKLSIIAILVIGAVMTFQSCDALTKASEITVNMPVSIPINANYTTLPNTQTNTVDVSTNSTFNDNKANLKGVDLASVSMILTNYSGTPVAANAVFSHISYTLKFDPSYGDNTTYTIGEFTNLSAASFMSEEKSFDVVNADLNSVLDKLADRPKFSVYSTYTLSSGNGTITSMQGTVTLRFKLKASVL